LLKRFKERNDIRELQIQSEQLSAVCGAATMFLDELAKIIKEKFSIIVKPTMWMKEDFTEE
jgi:hypothetical protein